MPKLREQIFCTTELGGQIVKLLLAQKSFMPYNGFRITARAWKESFWTFCKVLFKALHTSDIRLSTSNRALLVLFSTSLDVLRFLAKSDMLTTVVTFKFQSFQLCFLKPCQFNHMYGLFPARWARIGLLFPLHFPFLLLQTVQTKEVFTCAALPQLISQLEADLTV